MGNSKRRILVVVGIGRIPRLPHHRGMAFGLTRWTCISSVDCERVVTVWRHVTRFAAPAPHHRWTFPTDNEPRVKPRGDRMIMKARNASGLSVYMFSARCRSTQIPVYRQRARSRDFHCVSHHPPASIRVGHIPFHSSADVTPARGVCHVTLRSAASAGRRPASPRTPGPRNFRWLNPQLTSTLTLSSYVVGPALAPRLH
ncbi:hypothetical protein B0H10DRAFT_1327420 [Mycena sp. CBHHK59/15]|nr:hypothetical protein B0H10DRAFT_1327420 [Mycena sp. CBHHK59/15]